ncbi:MAG: hypothetical protein JW941_12705 [Candidatus Coatesbacteria bacterium]|nr:hypothetical protein [Candidatus Coatesbacteria bacterium]
MHKTDSIFFGILERPRLNACLAVILALSFLLASDCHKSVAMGSRGKIHREIKSSEGVRDLAFAGDGNSIIYIKKNETVVFNRDASDFLDLCELCLWSENDAQIQKPREVVGAGLWRSFPLFSNAGFPRYFFFNATSRKDCDLFLQGGASSFLLSPCIYSFDTQELTLDIRLQRRDEAMICSYKAGVPSDVLPVIINGAEVPGCLSMASNISRSTSPGSTVSDRISTSQLSLALYSLNDGLLSKLIELPGYSKSLDSCVIPTAGEPIIGVRRGVTSGRTTVDFLQGGKTLVAGTRGLAGVTPDRRFMFYFKRNFEDSSSDKPNSFWRLETATGKEIFVSKDIRGLSMRCAHDNKQFGVLQGQWDGDVLSIEACAIYDLGGKLIKRTAFPEPIIILGTPKNSAGYSTYDWDIDGEKLAYWDKKKGKIIVRKFDGSVISSFAP